MFKLKLSKQQAKQQAEQIQASDLVLLLRYVQDAFLQGQQIEGKQICDFVQVLEMVLGHCCTVSPLYQLQSALQATLLAYVQRNLAYFDEQTVINFALRQLIYKNKLFDVFSGISVKKYDQRSIFHKNRAELLESLHSFYQAYTESSQEPTFLLDPRLSFENAAIGERLLLDLLEPSSFEPKAIEQLRAFGGLFSDLPRVFCDFVQLLGQASKQTSKYYVPDYSYLAFLGDLKVYDLNYLKQLVALVQANYRSVFTPYTPQQLNEILAAALLCHQDLCKAYFAAIAGFMDDGTFYRQHLQLFADTRLYDLQRSAYMLDYQCKCVNMHKFCQYGGGVLDLLSRRGPCLFGDILEALSLDPVALARALPFCFRSEGQSMLNFHEGYDKSLNDMQFVARLLEQSYLDQLFSLQVLQNAGESLVSDSRFARWVSQLVRGVSLPQQDFEAKRLETEVRIVLSLRQMVALDEVSDVEVADLERWALYKAPVYQQISCDAAKQPFGELVQELLCDFSEEQLAGIFGQFLNCYSIDILTNAIGDDKERQCEFIACLQNHRYELKAFCKPGSKCLNFEALDRIFGELQASVQAENNTAGEYKRGILRGYRAQFNEEELQAIFNEIVERSKQVFVPREEIGEDTLTELFSAFYGVLSVGIVNSRDVYTIFVQTMKAVFGAPMIATCNQTGMVVNPSFSLILPASQETLEEIAKNIFRYLALSAKFGAVYYALLQNQTLVKRYYLRNVSQLSITQEYLCYLLLQYESSMATMNTRFSFAPDFRFLADYEQLRAQLDQAFAGISEKQATTFSDVSRPAAQLFYSLFGNSVRQQLRILQACKQLLLSEEDLDQRVAEYIGLQVDRLAFCACVDLIQETMERSGISRTSSIGLSEVQLEALFARFLLTNIPFAQFYLLALANFFYARGEVFALSVKLLDQNDIKRNVSATSCLALLLKERRLSLVNGHQFVAYALLLVDNIVLKLLEISERGWKTFLVFLVTEIKQLDAQYSERGLLLVVYLICCLLKQSQYKDKLWIRQIPAVLKDESQRVLVEAVSALNPLENDDDFIFQLVFKLLNQNSLHDLFYLDFSAFRFNSASMLYVFEPQQCVISILTNFYSLYSHLPESTVASLKILENCCKARCQTAVINAHHLHKMMSPTGHDDMPQPFAYDYQKALFDDFFGAVGDFILQEQIYIHQYSPEEPRYSIFYQDLSQKQRTAFAAVEEQINAVIANEAPEAQRMTELLTEIVGNDWENVSKLVQDGCGDDYNYSLLQACDVLKGGDPTGFVSALLESGSLNQLFVLLANNFYNYVQIQDLDCCLLKFMSIEALVELSRYLAYEDEEVRVSGVQKMKDLAKSIQRIVKSEPDYDELCQFLVQQIDKLNALSESAPWQSCEDALGEVLSNVLRYNVANDANVERVIDLIPARQPSQQLAVIYYDSRNQQSVFPGDGEGVFVQLFLQRILQELCLADFLELVAGSLPEVRKLYRGASAFESDQFPQFLTILRQKQQDLLTLKPTERIADFRFKDDDFAEIDQILALASRPQEVFPKDFDKIGLIMSTLFGFSAQTLTSYLQLVCAHIAAVLALKDYPISQFSSHFEKSDPFNYESMQMALENDINALQMFSSGTSAVICFGDEELVTVYYNYLTHNPYVLRLLLLVHAGVLGNRTKTVQKLTYCSAGLVRNAQFCIQLALRLPTERGPDFTYFEIYYITRIAADFVASRLSEVQFFKKALYAVAENCVHQKSRFSVMLFVDLLALAFQKANPAFLGSRIIKYGQKSKGQHDPATASIREHCSSSSELNFMLLLLLLQNQQLNALFSDDSQSAQLAAFPIGQEAVRHMLRHVARQVESVYRELDDDSQAILQHHQLVAQYRQTYSAIMTLFLLRRAEVSQDGQLGELLARTKEFIGEMYGETCKMLEDTAARHGASFEFAESRNLDENKYLERLSECVGEVRVSLSPEDKHCQQLATLLSELYETSACGVATEVLEKALAGNAVLSVLFKYAVDIRDFFILCVKHNALAQLANFVTGSAELVADYYWAGCSLGNAEFVAKAADIISVSLAFGAGDREPNHSAQKSTADSCFVQQTTDDLLLEDSSSAEEAESVLANELAAEPFSQHTSVAVRADSEFAALPTHQMFGGCAVDRRCTTFEGFFAAQDPLYQGVTTQFFNPAYRKIEAKSLNIDPRAVKYVSSAEQLKAFPDLEVPQQKKLLDGATMGDACDACGAPISFLAELSADPLERILQLNQQPGIFCSFTGKNLCPHCAESSGRFEEVLPKTGPEPMQISGKALTQLWRTFYEPVYKDDEFLLPQGIKRKFRFMKLRLPLIAACAALKEAVSACLNVSHLADDGQALYYKAKRLVPAQEQLKPSQERAEKAGQSILKKVPKSPIGEALLERVDEHDGDFESMLNLAIKAVCLHYQNCDVCVANFSECHQCGQKFIGLKYNFDMFARFAAGVKTTNAACAECGRILHKNCAGPDGLCTECAVFLKQFE